MKLLYAIALSLFPISPPAAAPAQSPDMSLLSALCSDDYYEDTAGDRSVISAGKVFTLDVVLEKHGAIITRDTDKEIVVFYLTDPEDIPAGSIYPCGESPTVENAIGTEDESSAQTATERDSIASQVVTAEWPLEQWTKPPTRLQLLARLRRASPHSRALSTTIGRSKEGARAKPNVDGPQNGEHTAVGPNQR